VDVIYRYARGGDRIDPELFKTAFWEDGAYSEHYSDEPIHKIADSLLHGLMDTTFSVTQHLNANILVEFIGTDVAQCETYFQAFHLTHPNLSKDNLLQLLGPRMFAKLDKQPAETYEIVVGGRYLDRFECRNGQWKIKARGLIYDWTSVRPGACLVQGEGITTNGRVHMKRDRTDPSYRR
jgi:hypothetical protein